MIYKYKQTTSELADWLGLNFDNHINPKKYFKPDKSILNTQTWKRYSCNNDEISYIENELKDYLYEFPDNQILQYIDNLFFKKLSFTETKPVDKHETH